MRAVARDVGVSATAIYRHFKSKDDLLRVVVRVGSERFALYLTRGLEGKTPLERLQRTGEGYLDFAFDHPEDYRIMFLSWDRLDLGAHSERGTTQPAPMFRFFLDRVKECLPQAPQPTPDVVMRSALLFWAQVHGMASLYIAGGGASLFPEEEFREMARLQAQTLIQLWSASHEGAHRNEPV